LPASRICSTTCAPYCVQERKNARFVLGSRIITDLKYDRFAHRYGEDGRLVTRTCNWLLNRPGQKRAKYCRFGMSAGKYRSASETCRAVCTFWPILERG
jgi:hypothetical protein